MRYSLIILVIISLIINTSATVSNDIFFTEEICDNGIDDDGDGLIDLNDPDCLCNEGTYGFEMLIPNPGFELIDDCCSTNLGLDSESCILDWEILSPTPDYFNQLCLTAEELASFEESYGFTIEDAFIRAYYEANGHSELFGICFSTALDVDYSYELSFDLIGNYNTNTAINFSLYGVKECVDLTELDFDDICDLDNVVELATIRHINDFEPTTWEEKAFSFVADYPYEAFFLDLSCLNPSFPSATAAFYFDDFKMKKSFEPFALVATEGSLCDESILLSSPLNSDYEYQWYLDGVAIVGANKNEFKPLVQGDYQLVVIDVISGNCFPSLTFVLDDYYDLIIKYHEALICKGNSYEFYGSNYAVEGIYEYIESSLNNCDTLHLLSLSTYLIDPFEPIVQVLIPGVPFEFGGQILTVPGLYYDTLQTTSGCDSLTTLLLISTEQIEDCYNGIDDDGDGLIDAFDPDCNCVNTYTKTYVANPGFELHSDCCYYMDEINNCVSDWQPIAGTPDYFGFDCFDASNYDEIYEVMLNDFESSFVAIGTNNYYSESLASCLKESLLTGEEYNVGFSVGLASDLLNTLVKPIDITVYGLSICSSDLLGLLGEGKEEICFNSWVPDAQKLITISTNDMSVMELKDFTTSFIAESDITSIVLSIDCGNPDFIGGSFIVIDYVEIYNDKLVSNWEFDALITASNTCESPITLSTVYADSVNYQWYSDSIPIVNATQHFIEIDNENLEQEYHVEIFNEHGCTLIKGIIENSSYVSFDTVFICSSEYYLFDNQYLNIEGDYSAFIEGEDGCDSLKNLYLDIFSPNANLLDTSFCSGDNIVINETEYSEAGTYQDTLLDGNGCDSILTIILMENNAFYAPIIYTSICKGSSYIFGNVAYYDAGIYQNVISSVNSCDSIQILELDVLENKNDSLTIEICSNEYYYFMGEELNLPGIYFDTLDTQQGCDSIIMLDLMVHDVPNIINSIELCSGDSMLINGSYVFNSGIYSDSLLNDFGCDSIIQHDVRFDLESNYFFNEEICEGTIYDFNGMDLSHTGLYVDTTLNTKGCDSIISLDLSVLENPELYIYEQLCDGDSIIMSDQIIKDEGFYESYSHSIDGCDTLLYIEIDLIDEIIGDTSIVNLNYGESYQFNGFNYYSSGIYDVILSSNNNSCDSIAYLRLKVESGIYIPNIFSPSSVMGNDRFLISGNEDVLIVNFEIYDRWGNLVFDNQNFRLSEGTNNFWDGNYNQSRVEIGVYVYKLEVLMNDGNTIKKLGSITVI